MITNEQIIERLKKVYDPEIPVNIYDLGLIYDVKTIKDEVYIIMSLASSTYPSTYMHEKVKNVVYKIPAVRKVHIDLAYEPELTFAKIKEKALQVNVF